MQLCGHLRQLRTVLLECLEPFDEVGIHVVGVDQSGVDFGEIPFQLIRRFGFTSPVIVRFSGAAVIIEQLLIPLGENQICAFVNLGTHDIRFAVPAIVLIRIVGIRAIDLVFRGVPVETLHFRRFKVTIQLYELLGELASGLHRFRQLHEVRFPVIREHVENLQVPCIHGFHVRGQFLHEQIKRPVAGVQFHRRFDEAVHGVRLAVVADDSERLVRPEQAVRAAERLDDAFVVDNLVEIQRIHPF